MKKFLIALLALGLIASPAFAGKNKHKHNDYYHGGNNNYYCCKNNNNNFYEDPNFWGGVAGGLIGGIIGGSIVNNQPYNHPYCREVPMTVYVPGYGYQLQPTVVCD